VVPLNQTTGILLGVAAAVLFSKSPPTANQQALSSPMAEQAYENIEAVYGTGFTQDLQNAVTTETTAGAVFDALSNTGSDTVNKTQSGSQYTSLRGVTYDELWRLVLSEVRTGRPFSRNGIPYSPTELYAQLTGQSSQQVYAQAYGDLGLGV